jgi:hypothetical protein
MRSMMRLENVRRGKRLREGAQAEGRDVLMAKASPHVSEPVKNQ